MTEILSARKIDRGETAVECPIERDSDGVWRVRGFAAGRAVLRSNDTKQAGLGVETVEKLPSKIRRPVLYRDGPEHREHRRQTAKYFTPRRPGSTGSSGRTSPTWPSISATSGRPPAYAGRPVETT